MSVRVVDNTPQVLAKVRRGVNLALRFALDDVDREAFRKTPKLSGELRKNLRKAVSGNRARITWASDYAWYQERGFTSGPVRRYTTPGTGAHFAQNAVKTVISRGFRNYLRKAGL